MATTENPVDLGDLERDVMQLIWAHGPMTSDTVRERLPRKLKESTVRTVLRRLEHKGFVKHAVDGRTYVFEALEPRRDVAAGLTSPQGRARRPARPRGRAQWVSVLPPVGE